MAAPKLLSEEQTHKLYRFVKSKYVDYYDVQMELVDHLACEIEKEWMANENIEFEHALSQVYKRFGIYGFSRIVQAKEAAIRRQNRLICWKEFKKFFKMPRIIFSLALLFVITIIASQLSTTAFIIVNSIFAVACTVNELLRRYRFKPVRKMKMASWQFSGTATLILNIVLGLDLNFVIRPAFPDFQWNVFLPVVAYFCWIAFWAGSHTFTILMSAQKKMYPEAFA